MGTKILYKFIRHLITVRDYDHFPRNALGRAEFTLATSASMKRVQHVLWSGPDGMEGLM